MELDLRAWKLDIGRNYTRLQTTLHCTLLDSTRLHSTPSQQSRLGLVFREAIEQLSSHWLFVTPAYRTFNIYVRSFWSMRKRTTTIAAWGMSVSMQWVAVREKSGERRRGAPKGAIRLHWAEHKIFLTLQWQSLRSHAHAHTHHTHKHRYIYCILMCHWNVI